MLGNSIEGFTPSKRKLVFTACVWSIVTYGSVLWFNKNAKGMKQKMNKLNKVKNMGMRWISGVFSTTPISALELITYTPPIIAQMNIITFKYVLQINKLSAIHPVHRLACTFQFQSIQSQRIRIKPSAYEKHSIFNMCHDPSLITDEQFVYNHNKQIFGKRILDLYKSNIKFINFDHLKKGTDLFNQWMNNYRTWLNTIHNDKDHLIISTDGSYRNKVGTASYMLWANHILIHSMASQIHVHSAFNAKLQAIQLAVEQMKLLPFKRITFLIDNEAAAHLIWHTDYHNLQQVSIKTMTNFREWTTHWRTKDFVVNVSWCPAHMDILENELVDSLTSEVTIREIDTKTTLESEIKRIQKIEFDAWNKTTHQHNGLGSGYLRLKYKGK
ncbi:hypothetical protein AX15_005873 [Amanita polypyramis BW_CC]|nr:hypothetical protein AX15_005873 [Amanita polypyramis BW_CC]